MTSSASAALIVTLLVPGCVDKSRQLPPIRGAISVLYVAEDGTPIRQRPEESSEQLESFPAGETVSVLSLRGEWAEVRFGVGSAWVRRSALTDSAEEARKEKGSTTIKFRNAPSPIYSQSTVHGEILLEASVTESGMVTEVRTVRNTTGSTPLEMRNRSELLRASFYPLLVNGKPKPFIYEYRISY